MILTLDEIDQWTQGDSIEVAGTLCRNPNDAWIVHIGTFYAYSEEPIKPQEDAEEMLKIGWVESGQWTKDELIEFIEDHKEEFK